MAAIALSACKVYRKFSGEMEDVMIVTPATADSADTVDCSSLLQGRTLRGASAWDSTSEDSVTCTSSSAVVTLDAAGGTTDHVYNISLRLL